MRILIALRRLSVCLCPFIRSGTALSMVLSAQSLLQWGTVACVAGAHGSLHSPAREARQEEPSNPDAAAQG